MSDQIQAKPSSLLQRRLALIMGILALLASASVVAGGLLTAAEVDWTKAGFMAVGAVPLLAYWWTGRDPEGFGKPLRRSP